MFALELERKTGSETSAHCHRLLMIRNHDVGDALVAVGHNGLRTVLLLLAQLLTPHPHFQSQTKIRPCVRRHESDGKVVRLALILMSVFLRVFVVLNVRHSLWP